MGGSNTKEEVLIAQNAAGGVNQATVEELKTGIGVTNVLLMILAILAALAMVYGGYRVYRNCHVEWIEQRIHHHALRRSFQRPKPEMGPSVIV